MGKNSKRRAKKRLQALQRARVAREEASAASAASGASAASTASASAPVATSESAMVEMMMQMTGQTREQVLRMRDKAFQYVQSQPADKVAAKVAALGGSTSELHTSLEEVQGIGGSDMHVWHEVDGVIYGLSCGVNGDIQEYNKNNPNSAFTLRRAYPPALQEECFEEFIRSKLVRARLIPPSMAASLLDNEEKWKNRCGERAALLMVLYPETFTRATLRIGGVGWRQGGCVHWEFG
jgi:hypothetical protein